MYIVKSFEPGLYTVGTGDTGNGSWQPEGDYEKREMADRRAFFLNHGREMDEPATGVPASAVDPWELFVASFISGTAQTAYERGFNQPKFAAAAAEFGDAMMRERAKWKGGAQ